jgi:hypothetical protein
VEHLSQRASELRMISQQLKASSLAMQALGTERAARFVEEHGRDLAELLESQAAAVRIAVKVDGSDR